MRGESANEESHRLLHGRYRVLRPVGRTARSACYLAIDTSSGAHVRLERLSSSLFGAPLSEPTVRETQLLRELRAHRHTSALEALLYDDDVSGTRWSDFDRVYRWYDYTLPCVLATASELGAPLVGSIALQMAQGVEVLHRAGVAHGSLTPACFLVNASGEVCLADLLPCRELGDLCVAPREFESAVPPLCAYAAPERLMGERWGAAADVWSLGCCLAELLSRRPLFQRAGSHGAQLLQLAELLGAPPVHSLPSWVSNARARALLEALPERPLATLADRMPGAPAQTLAVVQALLAFAPSDRPALGELLASLPFFATARAERAAAAAATGRGGGDAADEAAEVRPFRFRPLGAAGGLTREDELRMCMWAESVALHGGGCDQAAQPRQPPRIWRRPEAREAPPALEQLALRALLTASTASARARAAPAGARAGCARERALTAKSEEDERLELDSMLAHMLADAQLLDAGGVLSTPASFSALAEFPRLRRRVAEALRLGLAPLTADADGGCAATDGTGQAAGGCGIDALRSLVHGLRWQQARAADEPPVDGPAARSVAAHLIRELSEPPAADVVAEWRGQPRCADEFGSAPALLKLLHDVRALAPKHYGRSQCD